MTSIFRPKSKVSQKSATARDEHVATTKNKTCQNITGFHNFDEIVTPFPERIGKHYYRWWRLIGLLLLAARIGSMALCDEALTRYPINVIFTILPSTLAILIILMWSLAMAGNLYPTEDNNSIHLDQIRNSKIIDFGRMHSQWGNQSLNATMGWAQLPLGKARKLSKDKLEEDFFKELEQPVSPQNGTGQTSEDTLLSQKNTSTTQKNTISIQKDTSKTQENPTSTKEKKIPFLKKQRQQMN
ncbi:MAG: hypothetical protein JEY79_12740 [Pseudodesulfovibrio sp.]|nr:hypothetical protein [Pseudodesulfovibrio sp.]